MTTIAQRPNVICANHRYDRTQLVKTRCIEVLLLKGLPMEITQRKEEPALEYDMMGCGHEFPYAQL